MINFKQFLSECIDEAREDLWDTDAMAPDLGREPVDRFGSAHARQSKRAELWDAIMQFREGFIAEEDLFMFFQSFDKSVTYYDFLKFIEGQGYVGR